jgi:glycosyltransferase involved in cell wall biosynthesis
MRTDVPARNGSRTPAPALAAAMPPAPDGFSLAGRRIVVVGPLPPPAGGMAGQTDQLVRLLSAEGANVSLVQTNAPYRPSWIARLRGVRALFRLVPYVANLFAAAGRAELMHVMANSGWAWHLFAAPAVWIARLRRVPAIVNYRGGEAPEFLSRAIGIVRPTLRKSTAVAVPSRFLQEVFARFGQQTVVVPNIVDLELFRPAAAGERKAEAHIVVARNLEPIYDIGAAIRAMARLRETLPKARMSIAGSGPERPALEALAAELGVTGAVTFAGRLERREMASLYRSADAVLNPARVDNMPNSVLEALASGVPVVSTNVGGVPYIVEHGRTALLVDAGDSEAMAKALGEVLAQPPLTARLREAGLADVRRYGWDRVRTDLLSLYERSLAAHP